MLRSLKDLEGYTAKATDGEIGTVEGVLFDDERWVVRYLVVEARSDSGTRQVLISPVFFSTIQWQPRRFDLALTMDRVLRSPSVNADKPVSRQHERDYYRYYGYAPYWGYSGLWGMGSYPGLLATEKWREAPQGGPENVGDAHLQRAEDVRGYHIQGNDESVGHVEDFIVDDETWQIRYLVVDTSNWWFGKTVLVAPHWASRVSWAERKVYVDISREGVKHSPEWNVNEPINRKYEARLYDYYGRPVYWDGMVHALAGPHPQPSGRPTG